jgi:hypothetical protein
MTKSFTIFLVLLATTLSLTTAMFDNYIVIINKGGTDFVDADCDGTVLGEIVKDAIADVIQLCVAQAETQPTNPPFPSIPAHIHMLDRRRALSTTPSVSRQLNAVCGVNGYCVEACNVFGEVCACSVNAPQRRLEDEVLAEGDAAVASVTERELTPNEDWANKIEGKCKSAIKTYAQVLEDANNDCLGDKEHVDVKAFTIGS